MKACTQCGADKPLADFKARKSDRLVNQCIECRDRYAGWQDLTLDERLARKAPRRETGNGYFVSLTMVSHNRKTGAMPVSMTDTMSCPDACVFRGQGCYAEESKLRLHWLTVPERGMAWPDFVATVRRFTRGTFWRHNEAGDLPGKGDPIDRVAFMALVTANQRAGAHAFTFTHKPLRTAADRAIIRKANASGFTVNLSADNLRDADRLADLACGPVAVVVPVDEHRRLRTPKGRHVVMCPNETHGLTCIECRLCAHPGRKAVVGFRAHGKAKQMVSQLVQLRRKAATVAA